MIDFESPSPTQAHALDLASSRRDPETPGGLGLVLVDELCETWGVWQDLGPTCVWCELLLDQSRPRK